MTTERRPIPRTTRYFNRLAVRLAGTRLVPMWARVRHTGRKSGTSYQTPVAVVAAPGVFYIALPWGRETDWVRNLRAAGGGSVVWKGTVYAVSDPTFVDKSEMLAAARAPQRQLLARFPVHDCLRLRRVAGA